MPKPTAEPLDALRIVAIDLVEQGRTQDVFDLLIGAMRALQQDNARLAAQLAELLQGRGRSGGGSEKLSPDQLQLFAEQSDEAAAELQTRTRVVEHQGARPGGGPLVSFRSEAEYCGLNAATACPPAAFGKPVLQIDVNGVQTTTGYDHLGRLTSQGDDANGPGTPRSTVEHAMPVRRVAVFQVPDATGGLPSFARTETPTSAPGWAAETVWAAAWTDGLGRGVLATAEAIVEGEKGQKASGWSSRDTRGRVVEETWPCFGADEWDTQAAFDGIDPGASDLGLCSADVRRHGYAYDPADRVTGEVLPNGAVWQRDHRVEAGVNGIAHHDIFTAEDGDVLQEVDIVDGPRRKSTTRFGAESWIHDGAVGPWPSGMSKVNQPLEVVEEFDVFGRRTQVERRPEAPGNETIFKYDGWGRLVEYRDPDQGEWLFEFDSAGLLASRYELDRMGSEVRRTEWVHDRRGRVLEELEFDLAANPWDPIRGWEWTWDEGWALNGDSGPADAWGLGPIDRPTQALAWERGGCGEPLGRRTEQVFEWRHDLRGNVVEESQTWERCFEPGSDMPSTLLAQHAYDAAGQRYWTRMPLGEEVGVLRDDVGQAAWMGQVPDAGPWGIFDLGEPYLNAAGWDEFGRPELLALGNGAVQLFEFDETTQDMGALSGTAVNSPVDGLLLDRGYWWDDAGNLQRWHDKATAFASAEDFVCSYDGIGRLLGCDDPFGGKDSFEYRYDASGNLLYERVELDGRERRAWQYSASGGGLASVSNYDAPLNAPVARVQIGNNGPADGASSLTWDHRGQLVGLSHHDGSQVHGSGVVADEGLVNGAGIPWDALADRRFEWDANGRLRDVRVSTGAAYEDVSSFGYGPGGNRSWEQVLGDDGTTGVMRMAGIAVLTEGADGLVLTTHYSVAGRRIAQRSAEVVLVNGEPTAAPASTVRFFAGDHLGTTSLVLDEAGGLVSGARYEPFGRIREEFGSDLGEDYEFAATDRLFNGKLRQRAAFGLAGSGFEVEGYDYGARIYLPEYGRWASADSITPDLVWEANPYAYVVNNPLRWVDPTGHLTESAFEILYDARGEGFIKANTQCMQDSICAELFLSPALAAIGSAGVGPALRVLSGTGWGRKVLGSLKRAELPPPRLRDADRAADARKSARQAETASAGSRTPEVAGKPRFVGQKDGIVVDTQATPRGSYDQPDGGRTDVLQTEDHGASWSHTHDPIVNTNPKTGERFPNGTQQPGRPVSATDVENIRRGDAVPSKPRGR